METTNISKRKYLDRVKPSMILYTTLSLFNLLIYVAGILFILSVKLIWLKSLGMEITFGFIGFVLIIIGLKLTLDAINSGNTLDKFLNLSTNAVSRVCYRYTQEKVVGDCYGSPITVSNAFIYHIIVQFYVAGKEYVVDAKVNKELFDKTAKSKLLKLAYADSNPSMLLFEGEF